MEDDAVEIDHNDDGDEAVEIDLDEIEDVEAVTRDAVAAVEEVERSARASSSADDIDAMRREIADLRNRSMRTLADFDNFRKRAERERQESKRYALFEPMRDIVEVADNLERAATADGSLEDLRQGVEMILRQLRELMRRQGVEPVAAEGEPFDPNVHEAVSREESDEVSEPTVAQELQRGYVLHERLLRPAMVTVAVPTRAAASKPAEES